VECVTKSGFSGKMFGSSLVLIDFDTSHFSDVRVSEFGSFAAYVFSVGAVRKYDVVAQILK